MERSAAEESQRSAPPVSGGRAFPAANSAARAGTAGPVSPFCAEDVNFASLNRRRIMNGIIYLVGLIVVIMAILSLFGLR